MWRVGHLTVGDQNFGMRCIIKLMTPFHPGCMLHMAVDKTLFPFGSLSKTTFESSGGGSLVEIFLEAEAYGVPEQ